MNDHRASPKVAKVEGGSRARHRGWRIAILALCSLGFVSVAGCSDRLHEQPREDNLADSSPHNKTESEINSEWAAPLLAMQSASLEGLAMDWAKSGCTSALVAAANTECISIATRDALIANQMLDRVNELLLEDQPVEALLPIAQEARNAAELFFENICDRETAKAECEETTNEILDALTRYKSEVDRLLA